LILSSRNIVSILNAEVIGKNPVTLFDVVSIDSRSMQNNQETLFFALVGPNHDGHQYISELAQQGVSHFVVSQIPDSLNESLTFYHVKDTLVALQELAAYYRKEFDIPVIGITGSNGKTIIKEWLNFLLNPEYNIIRSPKSYNSQVGVPLSVLGINEKHNLAIFEAGISTTNEMEHLQRMIQPTIGIFSNIGSAHDEGFEDMGEKIKEKLKLFTGVSVLIINKNKTIEVFIPSKIKTFTWSSSDKSADVYIMTSEKGEGTQLKITYKALCFTVEIPFQDQASVENAIQCLMVLLHLQYSQETIQERMKLLYPVEMRLKVKNGTNNTSIIDDSYASDFQSLKIALDFLESQKQYKKKTLILSDIFQSGLPDEELYSKVSQLIISNKINRVVVIGATISKYAKKFPNCKAFLSTEDFLHHLDEINFENETLLIKGARNYQFEEIVAALEEKTHETVLEINLNAISHNLNFFKSKLDPTTKLMVMVKAFGYGNGGFEIAKLLEYHAIDYLGVAFADEGIALKTAGIQLPIMVMNPETTSFPSIIQHQLEPEIYSFKGLHSFLKLATAKKLNGFPIHIKLDTGMHRLGFQAADVAQLITILKDHPHVSVKSILSHLAASDDLELMDFTLHQIEEFESMSTAMIDELGYAPIRHLLNTSGISNFTNAQYDMVRLGIGLYGISNDAEEQKFLEVVSTLKSVISQIRFLNEGDSVGYGRGFRVTKPTKVATIPIGYADGISRQLGNENGYVMIKNKPAKILGSVCMDMMMVDVSDIDCKEGNEVIVFGKKPTVIEMAQQLHTIPYEIITGISQRVKRIFYRE
jgi:Alr-MurF fusion protein